MKFIKLFVSLLLILVPIISDAQEEQRAIQLSGIIKDENNQPVQYATIIVANRFKGTASDQKGMFSLIVYPNDTVRFSSIGFKLKNLIIPGNLPTFHYPVDIRLEFDTIQIAEIKIFRYATYEEFREALINLRLPEDDYQRAMANIALIKTQIYSDTGADPGLSYKHFMQEQHYRAMYKGQLPPNNLFNPFSWAQFIQAIREGRFKRN